MALIEWTSDMNTGVDLVDTQHRMLVDTVNRLHEAMQNNEELETLVGMMDEAVDLSIAHSRDEEKLLHDHGYKYADLHKDAHDRFNNRLSQVTSRIRTGTEPPETFLEEMNSYLDVHIRTHDKGFADLVGNAGDTTT